MAQTWKRKLTQKTTMQEIMIKEETSQDSEVSKQNKTIWKKILALIIEVVRRCLL